MKKLLLTLLTLLLAGILFTSTIEFISSIEEATPLSTSSTICIFISLVVGDLVTFCTFIGLWKDLFDVDE